MLSSQNLFAFTQNVKMTVRLSVCIQIQKRPKKTFLQMPFWAQYEKFADRVYPKTHNLIWIMNIFQALSNIEFK